MLMGETPLCENHVYTLNYLFHYRLRSFLGSRFPCSSCSSYISNLLTSLHLSYKLGLFNSQSTWLLYWHTSTELMLSLLYLHETSSMCDLRQHSKPHPFLRSAPTSRCTVLMAVACIICWHYASCVPITYYARNYAGIVGSQSTVNCFSPCFILGATLPQKHANATSKPPRYDHE